MALRLDEVCPHCGSPLSVMFKRDMIGGPLMACLRDDLGHETPWREVHGFDDVARLEPEASFCTCFGQQPHPLRGPHVPR